MSKKLRLSLAAMMFACTIKLAASKLNEMTLMGLSLVLGLFYSTIGIELTAGLFVLAYIGAFIREAKTSLGSSYFFSDRSLLSGDVLLPIFYKPVVWVC